MRTGGHSLAEDWAIAVAPLIPPGSPGLAPGEVAPGWLVAARRKPGRPMTDAEKGLLSDLASIVLIAVRNAAALASARETQRMRAELERERAVAEAMTEGLLPLPPALPAPYTLSTRYRAQSPEAPVGGDIYDVIALDECRVALILADVAGKGLQAAKQTVIVKYALRAYLREHADLDDAPGRLLGLLNTMLTLEPDVTGFVTLVCALLDTSTGILTYASAGHESLLLRADGTAEELPNTGPALGVVPAASYQTRRTTLRQGDGLLLFTDGLTEARAAHDRTAQLELEGVVRFLSHAVKNASPEMVADTLLESTRAFAGGRLSDDTAVLWLFHK